MAATSNEERGQKDDVELQQAIREKHNNGGNRTPQGIILSEQSYLTCISITEANIRGFLGVDLVMRHGERGYMMTLCYPFPLLVGIRTINGVLPSEYCKGNFK